MKRYVFDNGEYKYVDLTPEEISARESEELLAQQEAPELKRMTAIAEAEDRAYKALIRGDTAALDLARSELAALEK